MADFNALQAIINAYIKRNGVQAITGQILNGVLTGMVNALGKGYTVAGAASPTTDPGTMTGPLAYIAYTAGTYTHFDNLVVEQGEVSMLIYNEAEWHKEVLFSLAAQATVDDNIGVPAVGVSFVDGILTFDFRNMKGEPGENGQDGDPAGFGAISATITGGVGTPGVSVQSSGPDTAKNIAFQFTNLKGETGVTSCVVTVDNTTGNPSCAVSLVGQELHLDFSGLKGAQGDTGSSVDYPFTIVNNLTTDDATQALSAAQGVVLAGQVSQLEHEVGDLDAEINGGSETTITETQYSLPGFIAYSGGAITNTESSWIHSDIIPLADFVEAGQIQPHGSVAGVAFYNGTAFSNYISGINYPTIDNYMVDRKITKEAIAEIIPSGATHIAFSTDGSQYTLKVKTQTTVTTSGLVDRVDGIEDSIEDIEDSIEDIEPRLQSVEDDLNGTSPTPQQTQYSEPGYIKYADGSIVTGNTWIHSPLIPIEDFISATGFVFNGSVASAAFYSAEDRGAYISGYQVAAGYSHLTINKTDLTIPAGARYISLSTNGDTDTLVVTTAVATKGLKERVADLENEVRPSAGLSTKCLHFSFDDTIAAFYDIAHNNRASIFDNAFFGALKTLHDTYGCVFSCYCFLEHFSLKWVSKLSTIANPDITAVYFLGSADGQYAANTWYVYRNSAWTEFTDALRDDYKIFALEDMPATYAAEFSANSDWLKFGLHGKDGMVNYQSATAEEATADYNSFISSIVTITGTVECVDTVVRLQNFAGNVNVIRAMRDADLGVQGFLCSDYSETSGGSGGSSGGYIVSNALAIAVWKKGQIYDYAERLHFYVSGLRMDNTTSANMPAYMAKFLTPSKWEQTAMVEMYCHENQMYNASNNTLTSDYVARFESVCNWAAANGFAFGYQMDKIRMAF